jgi:hypothetical protein
MERTASFVWYGPFVLLGKRGDPPEVRLREIGNFTAAARGLYLFVGSMRRTLIRQDRLIYVGRTGRNFYQRLCEHLDQKRGDAAKLRLIESSGLVSSIWFASLESCPNLCIEPEDELQDDEGEEPGIPEHKAFENLLIHTALRNQSALPVAAADHANRLGFNAPTLNCVMLNRFNTDSWEHKHRPKWRPTMIPDIIDCHVESGEMLAQLIWTGTRGCAMQRRECRPGRLTGAPKSRPRGGVTPSL